MKISLFDISNRLSEIDKMFRPTIESLLPTIHKIDSTKLIEESGLSLQGNNVLLTITPKDYEYAGLDIFIAKDQLIVGFAGSEQYEDHHSNMIESDLIHTIEKYLTGIRIKTYYNKKGIIVKREWFYKDNSMIGTSRYSFNLFSLFTKNIEKEISISFFSA